MRKSVLLLSVMCIVISLFGCATASLSPQEQELARTYYNLGNTYERLGEYQSAVSAFKRALAIDPLFHEASYNLAVVHCLRGSYADSQQQFRSLLTYDPDNTKVLAALAWCFMKDRQTPQALEVYRRIAEIDPGDVHNRTNMIYLLLDLAHYEQASDALMELIEFSGPDAKLLYLLYEAEEAREPGSGIEWLKAAWQRDTANEQAAAALIKHYLDQDFEEDARRTAGRYLEDSPDWEAAAAYGDDLAFQLLRFLFISGDPEETSALLEGARESLRFTADELNSLIPEGFGDAREFTDDRQEQEEH